MRKTKSTKSALMMSILSLLLCCSMLLGTTFAWFTDEVSSKDNIIQSGKLDVELYWANATEVPASANWKDASQGAIFTADEIWEPGYVSARHLQVVNAGNLAFKYRLVITPTGDYSKLAEVIDVYFIDNATQAIGRVDLNSLTPVGTLKDLINDPDGAAYGSLLKNESKTVSIALKMRETAGNEYQELSLGDAFAIRVFATQLSSESDSFDNKYDEAATYPINAGATVPVVKDQNGNHTEERYEFDLMGKSTNLGDSDNKFGSASVPAAAVADEAENININVVETTLNSNIVVESDQKATTYEITASGIKSGNTENITVQLYIGEGLTGVQLYHNEENIASTYNPYTGNITFQTKSFSPFTVVYDEVAFEAVLPDSTDGKPVAKVTYKSEFVNTNLDWGSYGQWSPTEGLSNQLETAFEFQCAETAEQAAQSAYANWYCDFYVKLDAPLGENQIFLGGNYGTFGWIGFHNGDVTLGANQEIGLLESVTSNPWTYLDIATWVGTFVCGVGDVNNALSGATFTVMLRLTNPENPNDYFNVQTIIHTFN